MKHSPYPGALIVAALAMARGAGCAGGQKSAASPSTSGPMRAVAREEPFVERHFRLLSGDRWMGNGISYGPHRDGQRPGGPAPSDAELRQDLELISCHWNLLRLYSCAAPTEAILKIIDHDRLDLKVVLGAWIAVEERRDSTGVVLDRFPEVRAANRGEVESAIRLAAAFPTIVLAVSVGNETQIFWSDHRTPSVLLINYVREVRARSPVAVTVADDFNFWNKPESRAVADEVDFLMVHAHPLWNGLQLDDAMNWTRQTLAAVQAVHPDRPLVLGETGWATQKHNEGEQATLIRGEPGEPQQASFYDALSGWSKQERVPTFFFEAFDENWKGGSHPDEVEKHWGLFRADRTPKRAMLEAR